MAASRCNLWKGRFDSYFFGTVNSEATIDSHLRKQVKGLGSGISTVIQRQVKLSQSPTATQACSYSIVKDYDKNSNHLYDHTTSGPTQEITPIVTNVDRNDFISIAGNTYVPTLSKTGCKNRGTPHLATTSTSIHCLLKKMSLANTTSATGQQHEKLCIGPLMKMDNIVNDISKQYGGPPIVFIRETSLFGERMPTKQEWLKHEELYEALADVIVCTHITGLQRVREVTLRGEMIKLLNTNPNRLDGEQTVRISVKDIPLSVDDSVILRSLVAENIDVITIIREKLRVEHCEIQLTLSNPAEVYGFWTFYGSCISPRANSENLNAENV
ncbi:hypothetical protein MAR_002682 [Mya arenaria]|uniref:Uncharacterized protein n=1 Tax=Mya arenaria TaxID=6604 RepID=A0ABY7G6F8_MYAAR|nr:hypothetical protein MAR_002682 [Mya arenaria]